MKPGSHSDRPAARTGEAGSARLILLSLICFLVGALVTTLWSRHTSAKASTEAVGLSSASKAVLERLQTPIEIRFYSLLDPSTGPALKEFAQRVDQVLAAYQNEAQGKLKVVRYAAGTNINPNVAVADGIRGFDLDKGDGCYLGVALLSNGRKEVLPRLQPEWEAALESDLSRALERVGQPRPGTPGPASPAPLNPAIVEQVRQSIPDLPSTSVQDGTQILRAASLSEFAAAVTEMQAQVAEAEARFKEAQKSGTTAAQEAAMQKLQELQAAQTQKLKNIAARSQAMVDALNQLKSGSK